MKKSDFIKIIREVVRQELKKELPNALAQVFSQMMGQSQHPQVHSINTVRNVPKSTPPVPQPEVSDEVDEMVSLKSQLQEMFSGGTPVARATPPPQATAQQQKRFTSNPVLNEILNQTRPFNGMERRANSVGGMGAAMSPAVAMAASGYVSAAASPLGAGEMMAEEPAFARNMPTMPGASGPVLSELPAHARPIVREGQEGGSAPLEGMSIDSALDLKNHPALPDSIKSILSRDYRSLVKAMDKGKKK